ncbi:hypothetical protein CEP54_010795 [Fusarium duplospermum]|uniref:NYN domain-containing protein n=1 Tax=Fusarium duplospermum TaxID=1325734 RepID=A0A428PHY9_9HYPO|nr:hypothetical protein CEP54_010795 [Fusarium duplospermum]
MTPTMMPEEAQDICMFFVDDSNIWIEAQKFAASGNSHMPKLTDRDRDPRLRINIGKLIKTLLGGRSQGASYLYGSRPPPNDTVWKTFEKHKFDTKIYDRARGKEKQVDTAMSSDLSGESAELSTGAKYDPEIKEKYKRTVLIAITGDQDMVPPIKRALGLCEFTGPESTNLPDAEIIVCNELDGWGRLSFITPSNMRNEFYVEFPEVKGIDDMDGLMAKAKTQFEGLWKVVSWHEYANRFKEGPPAMVETSNMFAPLEGDGEAKSVEIMAKGESQPIRQSVRGASNPRKLPVGGEQSENAEESSLDDSSDNKANKWVTDMKFPDLGQACLDVIIDRCWKGLYDSAESLAKETASLNGAVTLPSAEALDQGYVSKMRDRCQRHLNLWVACWKQMGVVKSQTTKESTSCLILGNRLWT